MYESLKAKKRSVILDTDIGPDCDDVAALAILISYAKELDFPILGVCNCTSNIYGSATIDAIREFCSYDDFKIGMYSKPGFYSDHTRYNKYIAEKYSKKYNEGKLELLPHVTFYRKLLAEAEDDSVVLITIGMFNTLADFLKSEPDEISPLSGVELAEKKVHALVSMAAVLPAGREFNVICDYEAAKFVFDNFPKPMYLSDFKIGLSVFTGYDPADAENHKGDLLFDSFNLYTADWAKRGFNRSFDLTAVQFACEGVGDIYSLTSPGRLEFYNEAPDRLPNADATRFIEDENGNIRFMVKVADDKMIEKLLQSRMNQFYKE